MFEMVDPDKGPSRPMSSAACASSMVCSSASAALRVCDPEPGCQCPNDKNPIRFMSSSAHGPSPGFPGARHRSGSAPVRAMNSART
jgi:hypothetical protein